MPKGSLSSSSPGRQLIDAGRSGDLIAVRKLLDDGVDVNWKDNEGRTALMYASGNNHVEAVKLLLDRGALIDLQNNFGGTALSNACFYGKIDCVPLLLERGADMFMTGKSGKTAKDWAEEQGHADIVQLLDEYEAKKQNTPQTQVLNEVELPQAQVLGELVMEPINKALQEENGRLKTEVGILKEREICKQELMDEYKARAKNMEEEIQRGKDENQRFRDEVSSLKGKEAAMRVEIEYLKRIDEQLRLERNAERVMFQSMMSNLIGGPDDRKRKRNEDEETK